ncbi:phage portal protein [Desulfovibrio mangrovi]|uniref:phage portal protein n=1 Tax=Desulfovibrio mangrovi TaxID=2976983 RepID=UPI0022476036|nr:phage portal protein [Desulfovibrio mangrovi]UZP68731.1 phage portal protein [Desulfovibrio mangrovi]
MTTKCTARAFTFGEPEPVLDGYQYADHLGVYLLDNGRYYQTPVPFTGLARLLYANAYHGPLLEFKTLMVMRGFVPSAAISRRSMEAAATDYSVFANAYLQLHRNGYGEVVRATHLPAINMRRMKEPDTYGLLQVAGELTPFAAGEVFHFRNYDVTQSIYGKPRYLGAIQSMLLNEDATLFRRRYYKNGAHMGYVFYTSGADLEEADQDRIQKAIEGAKGLGNFRNMYLHIPNGEAKAVQILPVGDFSSKDELEKIKNISRDDIIAAHRIPPAMANVIPTNTAGFGDIEAYDRVYEKNEIAPVRQMLLDVNEVLRPDLAVRWQVAAPLPEDSEEDAAAESMAGKGKSKGKDAAFKAG